MNGMAWMTVVVVVGKISGFASQWVLGLLLSPVDFGVYALVTVAQNFIEGFRDIGASRILIQRGGEYERLAGPILKLSLAANAVAILALVGGAPLIAHYYAEPKLLLLIPLTALAIPWSTVAVIHKAKLNRDLNYKAVGKIESVLPLVQNGLMILFAYLGFGVLSFVLPFTIGSVLQMVIYRQVVGKIPPGAKLTRSLFWDIFHQCKWLMLGAYGMGLVLRGDYLVLGRVFEQKADLGIYYFGFQLAASISVLFTTGLQNVLMPVFSKLTDDPGRLRNAFTRSCRMLMIATTLLTGAFIAVCPELLQFLWHGKWSAAALVAGLITFSLPFKLLAPVASSILEARGKWRDRTMLLLLDGAFVCISAGLGAHWGGLMGAGVAVAIQRCLIGLLQAHYAARMISIETGRMMQLLTAGLLPLIVGLGFLWLLPFSLLTSPAEIGSMAASAGTKLLVFTIGWLATVFLLNRTGWDEVRTMVLNKLNRPTLAA